MSGRYNIFLEISEGLTFFVQDPQDLMLKRCIYRIANERKGYRFMGREYKAISYIVTKNHKDVVFGKEPEGKESVYDTFEKRYCIVSTKTGEILDDAQGYGYKTAQKAYSAYAYKTRDKTKDKEKAEKKRHIRKWMKEHKSFVSFMDDIALEIAMGKWAPDDKFNAKLVQKMLDDNELKPDFTAAELLRVWRNG